MIHKLSRRLPCLLLAVLMIGTMLPVYTFAEDTGTGETAPVTVDITEPTEEVPSPTETVPEETVPEETAPEVTEPVVPPTEPVPPSTEPVPEETVPEETVPEETVPEETVPEVTEPLTPEEELLLKLETMYQDILVRTEKESLSGFCATLVSWEMFLSGVSGEFLRGDGKDQFDNYKDMEKTAGGYYVLPLSAEDYTLEEALMVLTKDGTKDVGPVLVGFEKTRSPEGALYGHTVFIGGIIEGNVYYVESNDYTVAGVEYPEGTPIVCTIDQFVYQYSGWTTLEGVVGFSETRYREECSYIPTDVYIRADAVTELRTEPCLSEVSIWSRYVRTVRTREVFHVNALVRDTEGNYWYQTAQEDPLYLSAENTSLVHSDYSGAEAREIVVPVGMEAGGKFRLSGTVYAGGSTLRMVRAQIFSGPAGEGNLVKNAAVMVDATEYDLKKLTGDLQVRDLEPGVYRCEISAIVRNTFLRDGELKYRSKLVDLWTAEFQVCAENEVSVLQPVFLDLQGGSGAPQQILLEEGAEIPENLIPVRPGYRFDGWCLSEAQEGAVPSDEVTMYAGWIEDTAGMDGWRLVNGQWRCYEDGAAVTGLVFWEGVSYFVMPDGSFHIGWMEWNNKTYYFFENGACACGILTIDGEQYVFDQTGAVSMARVLQ